MDEAGVFYQSVESRSCSRLDPHGPLVSSFPALRAGFGQRTEEEPVCLGATKLAFPKGAGWCIDLNRELRILHQLAVACTKLNLRLRFVHGRSAQQARLESSL